MIFRFQAVFRSVRLCRGLRKLQFRHAFEDAYRQKCPARPNKEYRCTDHCHTMDKEVAHTCKYHRNDFDRGNSRL